MAKHEVVSFDMDKASFHVFLAFCKGCGLCKEKCPKETLRFSDKLGAFGTPSIEPKDMVSCIACGLCEQCCPDCAIKIERKQRTTKN
jgi:2-oxoglutarate ferredoxin oxidoreductase subunit delta